MPRCKYCGRVIYWIRTAKGASMPVDPVPVPYWDTGGEGRVVLQDGETIACSLHGEKGDHAGIGYIPHWSSCLGADEARRRK